MQTPIPQTEHYRQVLDAIAQAADAAQRPPPVLIAVSKNQPVQAVQTLYDLGHRDFGENTLQGLTYRSDRLPTDIRWHFIGRIQSRKAADIYRRSTMVHSLDRHKLLKTLPSACPFLVQINIGREAQKGGVLPDQAQAWFETSIAQGHPPKGLMAIPPQSDAPEPYFEALQSLSKRLPFTEKPYLSMGMSSDFKTAIRFGATHIRIGTALFGPRHADLP